MTRSLAEKEERLAAASDDAERMTLLNELALDLSRIDPRRGLLLAAEARELAAERHDTSALAEHFRVAAYCHETLSDYPTAMSHARRAVQLFHEIGDRVGEGRSQNAVGVIAFCMNEFTAALDALHTARDILTVENHKQGVASACNNVGMIHQELGNYPEALEAYFGALRINEELGEESLVAANIGNISNVYYYLGDLDRSYEYDKRALEVSRRLNNHYGVALALERISSNYKERGEYDEAFEALNEALDAFRGMQEKRYEAAALIKLGTLYELRNEPKPALETYQQAALIAESIAKRDLLANARFHIGMLHAHRRKHKNAIPVLRQALDNAREGGLAKLESDILRVLAESLNALGDHAEAYSCLKECTALVESLYGEERQRAVAEMQARFDVERAEREREVLLLKNEHLQEIVDLRSKELTSMAMRLVQKNAFLQKLRKETLLLADENPESKEMLRQLLTSITGNLHADDEWERFEQEFQLMHHNFLNVISGRYPTLTPAELKICAMLKINLSNKEISNLLSVSVRSIESHRYSIRKKLGLSPDDNLTAALVGMGWEKSAIAL